MTNRRALARPSVLACLATVMLASTAIASAVGNEVPVPKLFQEASFQADPKSSPIKTLMSDSGELSVMAKRRSGFLPSRGKKDSEPFADYATGDTFDDAARIAFLSDASKRASGFLPMRGRKSSADLEDFEEMMKKRRVSAFMPMRGRKWNVENEIGMPMGQAESAVPVKLTANRWYPRHYPASFGATAADVAQPASIMYYPIKTDSASYFNEEQQPAMDAIEKRKGMGFFGARGKRSAV